MKSQEADRTVPATARSSRESVGNDDAEAIASILEPPARRNREALPVTVTQVVSMGVDFLDEVVNPHERPTVLIGQRHGRLVFAPTTRTLASHVSTVILGTAHMVDDRYSPARHDRLARVAVA